MSELEWKKKLAPEQCNGRVFDDGPKAKGGKRYCINSVALQFERKSSK